MIEDDAKKALLKLFQCFNVNGSDAERRIKFTAYWDVLGRLPPTIIIAICAKASRGEICDHGYLPSVAELYRAAVQQLPPVKYQKLEHRPYISPEQRTRILKEFKDLAAELKAGPIQRSVKGWETLGSAVIEVFDEEKLKAEYRDKPLPLLPPELRAKLGACIPRIEE
jgi:hypothetical protein